MFYNIKNKYLIFSILLIFSYLCTIQKGKYLQAIKNKNMKYLALENQDTKKEWLDQQDFNITSKSSNFLFISEECFFDGDRDIDEDYIEYNEDMFTENSHIFIEEENGNKEHFIVKSYETSKAEDLVKELKEFSINAKKANTTDSVYIELDSEIEGFENIRISDHDANGKHSTTLEIDINKITDIVDFCSELEQFISWEDLELIENWIYKA